MSDTSNASRAAIAAARFAAATRTSAFDLPPSKAIQVSETPALHVGSGLQLPSFGAHWVCAVAARIGRRSACAAVRLASAARICLSSWMISGRCAREVSTRVVSSGRSVGGSGQPPSTTGEWTASIHPIAARRFASATASFEWACASADRAFATFAVACATSIGSLACAATNRFA